MAGGASAVVFACELNGVILLVLLLLFEMLLRCPRARGFVAPFLASGDAGSGGGAAADEADAVPGRAVAAAEFLPPGPFGWARKVWPGRGSCGQLPPDAFMVVNFLQLGWKFCLAGSFADLVLISMYASGHGGQISLLRFGISNLALDGGDSFLLWGNILFAYVLTGMLMMLLLFEWRKFKQLRRDHFKRSVEGAVDGHAEGSERAQVQRSLLVERVPTSVMTAQGVRNFFARCIGHGTVQSCSLFRPAESAHLDRVVPLVMRQPVDAHWETLLDVETHGQSLQGALPVHQMAAQAGLGAADVIQTFTVGTNAVSTAIVTFDSAAACLEAQQVVLSHDGDWIVEPAPEPNDILQHTFTKRIQDVNRFHCVGMMLHICGLLFWSVPVTFIQCWASLKSFPKEWHLEEWVFNLSPAMYALLMEYLPVLALICLQFALPWLLEKMVKCEGHKTKSHVQRIVLTRLFAYAMFSLYVTVFSRSTWESLKDVVDRPKDMLNILGTSMPGSSVYFITFILTKVGSSLPFRLLRPWSLQWCCREGGAFGSREPEHCEVSSETVGVAQVLVLCVTYSFITPAMLPTGALYFGLASLVYRWLFAYVYTPEFDSGGKFWYDLFHCVMVGLLLGTLSLLGTVGLNAGYRSTHFLALTPLPVLVIWFWRWCFLNPRRVSRFVTMKDALDADDVVRTRLGSLAPPHNPNMYGEWLANVDVHQPRIGVGSLRRMGATRDLDVSHQVSRSLRRTGASQGIDVSP